VSIVITLTSNQNKTYTIIVIIFSGSATQRGLEAAVNHIYLYP
jgi:hypothetical protein